MPKASWVKLRDPFQRVIAAGVAIAGEIAHGTEHAEDGCSRGRLQSFTKVAEKSHRSRPEQLVYYYKSRSTDCSRKDIWQPNLTTFPLSTSCSGRDLSLSTSFTKVAEKSHRSRPEQLVESGKVVRLGCHISFLEQSVLLLL